jgi:hypothetical protein
LHFADGTNEDAQSFHLYPQRNFTQFSQA